MHSFRFFSSTFRHFRHGFAATAAASTTFSSSQLHTTSFDEEKRLSVPYLLIGGGTASYFAALTIRARDPEARVLIVTSEPQSPYNRSALSKEIWWYGDDNTPKSLTYTRPSGGLRNLQYEADGFYPCHAEMDTNEYYRHGGILLLRNANVVKVDATSKLAELEDGRIIGFGKCLIATGSRAKQLPAFGRCDDPRLKQSISLLRDVEDYRRLEAILQNTDVKRVAIIGGGFLATELAYSLHRRYGDHPASIRVEENRSPMEVYQIFREPGLLAHYLPPSLSDYCTLQTRHLGIHVMNGSTVCGARLSGDFSKDGKQKIMLEIEQNNSNNRLITYKSAGGADNAEKKGNVRVKDVEFDQVIVATGFQPNVELAQASGFELDKELGGIKADSGMLVKDSVWAAGDVCAFDDQTLKRRRRVERLENAQVTGRVAGENMTNGRKAYTHQGSFYTIFGVGDQITAVGEVDAQKFKTITYLFRDCDDQQLRAVVFYVDDGRVVGALFCNVYGFSLEMARRIILDGRQHTKFDDLVRLLDVYNEKEQHAEEKESVVEEESASIDNTTVPSAISGSKNKETSLKS